MIKLEIGKEKYGDFVKHAMFESPVVPRIGETISDYGTVEQVRYEFVSGELDLVKIYLQ